MLIIMGILIILIFSVCNYYIYKHNKDPQITQTLGALYPNKDIEIDASMKVYMEELDTILKDSRITNIAVSAPYGIGKSSVLESFFENRKYEYPLYIRVCNSWIRFINKFKQKYFFSAQLTSEIDDYDFVNIPNFFSKDTDTDILQQKIIEQLLFKVNYKRFPYSKIKRINDRSAIANMTLYVFLLTLGVSLFYFYFNYFQPKYNFSNMLSGFSYFESILFIYSCLGICISLYYIFKKLTTLFSKSTIHGKGTWGPFEVTTTNNTEQDNVSAFNIYSEELIYFFKRSRQRFIIFEDLDRFENPKIFQELRELNLSLNKRFSKIVFIYSLQDKIFKNNFTDEKSLNTTEEDDVVRQKAKFFDYVIPIFPNTSLYNSWQTIDEEIRKYSTIKVKNNITEEFLKRIGYFLKDKRMIILIVKEYFTYVKILIERSEEEQVKLINPEKLFGVVTYKNFFPDDFEKLGYGKSFLNKLFDNTNLIFNSVYKSKSASLEKDIENKKEAVSSLRNFVAQDISYFLKIYYNHLFKRKETYNNYPRFISLKGEKYGEDDFIPFFNSAVLLDDNTKVLLKEEYTNNTIDTFVIQDFYTCMNDRDNIKEIAKAYQENNFVNDQIAYFDNEIKSKQEELQALRNSIYNDSISNVIMENFDYLIENSILQEEMAFIKNNEIVQFLLNNKCLDVDLFQYISPIFYGKKNDDSLFIQKVLSIGIETDYRVLNPESTINELIHMTVPFYSAYSSDILISLIEDFKEIQHSKEIIKTVVDKDDYEFFDNLVRKTREKSSVLISVLILFSEENQNYIENLFKHDSPGAFEIVYFFVDNPKLVKNKLAGLYFNIIKYMLKSKNIFLELLSYSIKKNNKEFIKIEREELLVEDLNFLDKIDDRLMDEILKYNLFQPSESNFSYINSYYSIENSFSKFRKVLIEKNVKSISTKALYQYFKDLYSSKFKILYSDFKFFALSYLNKDNFFNDFNNEDINESEREQELINLYSNLLFVETVNVESNEEILNILNYENQLKQKYDGYKNHLQKILADSKIYFSENIYKLLTEINLVSEYILSLEKIYPEIYVEQITFLLDNLKEAEKLVIIKQTVLAESITVLGESLEGDFEVWVKLNSTEDFFDYDFIEGLIYNAESISYKVLFTLLKVVTRENKYLILDAILEQYPNELSIVDFENIIDLDYDRSFATGPSTAHWDVPESGIDKNILSVLDNKGIIEYKKERKFVVKKAIKRFFRFDQY